MFFIYVLYSSKFDKFYVGMTKDVGKRLKQHNSGKVKSTKAYLEWKVIHSESFDTREEAHRREKYLKTAAGRRWRKNNLGL